MSTDLMKGDFQLPAQHKPFQDGLGRNLLIGTQKRLGIELPLWVPNQHPTDGDGWQPVMIPDGSGTRQFDRAFSSSIPDHRDALPDGDRIGQPRCQSGLTRSLLAGTPVGSRLANRSRIIEGRIQAQTGDDGDGLDHPGRTREQFQHRVTAVGYDNQPASGQPPTQSPDHLSSPISELFVSAAMLLVVALRRSQDGEKGQGPDPLNPRNGNQQHHRNPAQPARFDKEFFARPHRVPIDAFGYNLGTTAAFNRLVDADHNGGICGHKDLDQHLQEQAGERSRRPLRSVEYTVVILKLLLVVQTHHAQHRRHRSFSRCQNGSNQQYFGPFPDPFAKRSFKVVQHLYNPFRQIEHLSSLFISDLSEAYSAVRFLSSQWIKSS